MQAHICALVRAHTHTHTHMHTHACTYMHAHTHADTLITHSLCSCRYALRIFGGDGLVLLASSRKMLFSRGYSCSQKIPLTCTFPLSLSRKLRKQLQQTDFKRAARNPWRGLNVKTSMPLSAVIANRSSPAPTSQPSQEVVVLD